MCELVKKDPKLLLIQNELLSENYIHTLAVEVQNIIRSCGKIELSHISQKYALPADFVKKCIIQTQGDVVIGQFRGSTLYTDTFMSRVKCIVRGTLSACTQPVSMSKISHTHTLDTEMICAAANEIVYVNKSVNGEIVNNIFTPYIYTYLFKNQLEKFYVGNDLIPLNMVKSFLKIKSASMSVDTFLKSEFDDGVILDTIYVSNKLILTVTAYIQQMISSNTWCDLRPLLPEAFTDLDVQALLTHIYTSKKMKSEYHLIDSWFVCVSQFLHTLTHTLTPAIEEYMRNWFAIQTQKPVVQIGTLENSDSDEGKTSRIKKKKKKVCE